MAPDQHVDVAIVGGGVVGAAIAYFLAQRGAQPLVIEGREVAYGASGKAAGLLSPNVPPGGEAADLAPLVARSVALHGLLAELLDGPGTYDYTPYETCVIARNEAEATELRAGTTGRSGEPLSAGAVGERFPWLDRPVAGGIAQQTAQLDPARFTERLLEAAKGMGASLRMGRATGLVGGEDYVAGVELEDGVVTAEATVIAMGPWSYRAAAWLDLPLPVRPLKGQILHLEPSSAPPPGGFSDLDGQYVVTRPTGLVYAGTTEEEAGFDLETTEEAREHILATLARYTSRLGAMRVVNQTACLRPLSEDGLPFIGAAPGRQGAYVATGHGRKGILLALATGEALADLIAEGRSSAVDLKPFDPARFGGEPSARTTS